MSIYVENFLYRIGAMVRSLLSQVANGPSAVIIIGSGGGPSE